MTHTEIIKELERIEQSSEYGKVPAWMIEELISRIQEDEDRMSEEMAKENV